MLFLFFFAQSRLCEWHLNRMTRHKLTGMACLKNHSHREKAIYFIFAAYTLIFSDGSLLFFAFIVAFALVWIGNKTLSMFCIDLNKCSSSPQVPSIWLSHVCMDQSTNNNNNKKVLLRTRKRHTARRVAALTPNRGVGGVRYPHPVLMGGIPIQSQLPSWLNGNTPLSGRMGVPPVKKCGNTP